MKNQRFSDEETLMEMLFDFSLGTRSPYTEQLVAGIDKELADNEKYQEYIKTIPDIDDRAEVYEEERDMRLAEILMEQFKTFEVKNACLYGLSDNGSELLFEVDLY